MITIEETLKSADLNADIKPHMVWRELLLGVSKRKVFLGLVLETDVLIGNQGTKISVPYFSAGYTATSATEATIDGGMTVTNPTIDDIDIAEGTVTNLANAIYVAFALSTILREDQPKYNWVRSNLFKAMDAILDKIDADIRDVLLAGAGNTQQAATGGTLAYNDVVGCLRLLKVDSWFPDEGIPTVVMHPDQEEDLLKATTFTETIRWQQGSIPFSGNLGGPLVPLFAGCKVLVSDNMTQALALVVTPQTHKFGPNTIFAWKRRPTVERDREVLNGRDVYVTSVRYGLAVVQANAVGLISEC